MIDDDTYLRHRADTELEQVRQANDPAIAAVHQKLADAYLAKLSGEPTQAQTS